MSHDHTPDSLFDSFTQPDPASGSRPRPYARPSTSLTSYSPRPGSALGPEHELAAGEETLERMMEQGGRTRRDREQRTRTRKRARGERDNARARGNVDTSGTDGDDLDELFEIPRPRTRTSSSKGSKVSQTKKKAGKGGKPRMTPYQDDPSLDLSLDPGSDSNISANSDDEDGTHGTPEDGYGTEGSGQDEGDLETQIFNSIGLFPSTSSTLDLDHHVEHHNHLRAMTTSINTPRLKPKSNPKQREPGWKGPLESSALKHGPQRGMFDFPLSPDVEYIPNPDYQTLHDLAQHTLASTAFLYAGGPYAVGPPASLSLSGMGTGMGSDMGIGRVQGAGAGGWGVKGARGKFGVGILPRGG
ncbi:hypothetical protein HD553DRAFT_316188 [Filobasidium floriforme]|uniref:uncharacterized protein n=1 Tax=Filobasidium floriforme TaxID=5210 RepID=UPI001E8D09E2|nr:uncharacterized protein HD553DRAFT_316188 [Filobasidium floriforme]KAH8081255.1 hypothetical protein HD553DRAFT_316188 [Filobasidium floriforme]